jgi:hypothetical protein
MSFSRSASYLSVQWQASLKGPSHSVIQNLLSFSQKILGQPKSSSEVPEQLVVLLQARCVQLGTNVAANGREPLGKPLPSRQQQEEFLTLDSSRLMVLNQWFLNVSHAPDSPGWALTLQLLVPTPTASGPQDMGEASEWTFGKCPTLVLLVLEPWLEMMLSHPKWQILSHPKWQSSPLLEPCLCQNVFTVS